MLQKIYGMALESNQHIYFAYGYCRDTSSSQIADLAIAIRIDNSNQTFSVLPYEYLQKNNYLNVTEQSKIEINKTEKIENKTYNVYENKYQSEEDYVTKLFENYMNRAFVSYRTCLSVLKYTI